MGDAKRWPEVSLAEIMKVPSGASQKIRLVPDGIDAMLLHDEEGRAWRVTKDGFVIDGSLRSEYTICFEGESEYWAVLRSEIARPNCHV